MCAYDFHTNTINFTQALKWESVFYYESNVLCPDPARIQLCHNQSNGTSAISTLASSLQERNGKEIIKVGLQPCTTPSLHFIIWWIKISRSMLIIVRLKNWCFFIYGYIMQRQCILFKVLFLLYIHAWGGGSGRTLFACSVDP